VKTSGLYLDAVVGSVDGSVTYRKKLRGSKREAVKLGVSLAEDLLKAGADEILTEVYNSVRR
jgi:hydroxymethylbilane synthase